MSPDWKDQLKHVYKNLQQDKKNKKGLQSKFDSVVGYKNKKGFNDTGIPLTARAAKQLQKNKAAYRGRYIGTTLQQINEERAATAKERWKHLKPGHRHSTDTAPTKKGYSSSELMWRNSATRIGERGWYNQPSTFKGRGYSDPPADSPAPVDYIWSEPKIKDPGSDYKPGKFPKLDEAIRHAKRKKR